MTVTGLAAHPVAGQGLVEWCRGHRRLAITVRQAGLRWSMFSTRQLVMAVRFGMKARQRFMTSEVHAWRSRIVSDGVS